MSNKRFRAHQRSVAQGSRFTGAGRRHPFEPFGRWGNRNPGAASRCHLGIDTVTCSRRTRYPEDQGRKPIETPADAATAASRYQRQIPALVMKGFPARNVVAPDGTPYQDEMGGKARIGRSSTQRPVTWPLDLIR